MIGNDSLHTELGDWIMTGMVAGNLIAQQKYPNDPSKGMRIAVKGDRDADYATVKKVLKILQDKKILRFNLVTDLDGTQFAEEMKKEKNQPKK